MRIRTLLGGEVSRRQAEVDVDAALHEWDLDVLLLTYGSLHVCRHEAAAKGSDVSLIDADIATVGYEIEERMRPEVALHRATRRAAPEIAELLDAGDTHGAMGALLARLESGGFPPDTDAEEESR